MTPTAESPFPQFKRYLPCDFTPVGVMHVIDRVVGGQFLLGDEEKDHFRALLLKLVPFSGLELLTWTCMTNHYHLLLKVPNQGEARHLREEVTEEEIFARMKGCFSPEYIQEVRWRVDAYRRDGKPAMAEIIFTRLRAQMYDVSAFMHMLKRRFSAWYNKRHGRKGTLWEGRFRSVLVQDSDETVLKMAAYIDLNSVRAGLVKDPKNYRWCGYAEAVAGVKLAQNGISEVVRSSAQATSVTWAEASAAYRGWLYDAGTEVRGEDGKITRRGVDPEELARVRESGGRLSRGQLLHCKVRYFADGIAIGSKAFVDSVFDEYRQRFGENRKTGARPLRYGDWQGTCSLRDLQKDVITVPTRGKGPPG